MDENRITARLTAGRNGGAWLPYFTAGYPDPATMIRLVGEADAHGAAVVEIGFPYSDSVADGPVIQDSFHAVLQRGHTLEDTFALVEKLRPTVSCGLAAMLSYSIVHRVGVEAFVARAAKVGFDGVILPDLPPEEGHVVHRTLAQAGLCHIGLVAPTTHPSRRKAIAQASSGFIYQIASTGTTGEREEISTSLAGSVARLRQESGLPICVGFGISNGHQVRQVCGFADGAIVGSAIMKRVSEAVARGDSPESIRVSLSSFLAELASGTQTS